MFDIKSMTLDELQSLMLANGFEKFRGTQIYGWLLKSAGSFSEMINLPGNLRDFLEKNCYICKLIIEKKLVSKSDNAVDKKDSGADTKDLQFYSPPVCRPDGASCVKYLFKLRDGQFIESVVMRYHHGYTICVSTQSGCKMNCAFCATGKGGFLRNLTASEMLAQIESSQKDLNLRISNVVLMGMGEPLDNFDNVLRFLHLVSAEKGLHIGMRHISLSTCGLVPQIYKLAEHKLGLTLSVSLHASNDGIRSKIIPVNKKYNISSLIKSCDYYTKKTGRRISFEYAMIKNVNDTLSCAKELAKLLKNRLCHVNLIPVNEVAGINFKKSDKKNLKMFVDVLSRENITATVRRTLGSDINASCGQLRAKSSDS